MLQKTKRQITRLYSILKGTIDRFNKDKAFRHGAAIAYYTLFSLPAILIIVIRLAALLFDEQEVKQVVLQEIIDSLGPESARQVDYMMTHINRESSSIWATLIGVGTLLFGATGVFYSLQDSLNAIWNLPDKIRQRSFLKYLFDRFLSFTMVLSLGFILMVSMILNTLIVALNAVLQNWGEEVRGLMYNISPNMGAYAEQFDVIFLFAYGMDALVGIIVVTITFALIFKFMSSADPRWRDVMVGALFAAVLFNIGKIGFGFYIGTTNVGNTYGAAGSIVLILLWVYFSAQILLLGAELIQEVVERRGGQIKPSTIAIKLVDQPLQRLKERFLRFWARMTSSSNHEPEGGPLASEEEIPAGDPAAEAGEEANPEGEANDLVPSVEEDREGS